MWWMPRANTRLWECQGRSSLKARKKKKKRGQTHNKPLVSCRRSLCIDETSFPLDKKDEGGSRQGWRGLQIRAVYASTPIQLRRSTSICTLPLCPAETALNVFLMPHRLTPTGRACELRVWITLPKVDIQEIPSQWLYYYYLLISWSVSFFILTVYCLFVRVPHSFYNKTILPGIHKKLNNKILEKKNNKII